MKNDYLIEVNSVEDVVEYMLDISEEYDEDSRVVVILRREEALKCFSILVEDYDMDVLLAKVNPDDEDLFYEVSIGYGDIAIESICSGVGNYLDCCADYMLIDEDVPSKWLIAQSCSNYDVLVLDDDCDEECNCNGCACLEEGSISLEELIDILDVDGGLAKIFKAFGDLV